VPAARIVAAFIALGACLALAQEPLRSFEIQIAERRVPPAQRVLRATEGERVELRWSADQPLVLHLHGYDIETRVAPGKPALTAFTARLTGRFGRIANGARSTASALRMRIQLAALPAHAAAPSASVDLPPLLSLPRRGGAAILPFFA
jgi:hypothetical protein